jgi:uncharacterized protein
MGIKAFDRDDWRWLNEPGTWSDRDGLAITSDEALVG